MVRTIVSIEVGRTWKKGVFVSFQVLSRHLHEGLTETSHDSRSTGLNQGLYDNETGRLVSRSEYLVQNTRRPFPEDWSTPVAKSRSFDKAKPNSLFRGKYIRYNLIRILDSLICKLSGTPD
jgi:hypothetical protein